MEVRYGANNTDDSSCHSFYIIKFSSSTYILQENLIVQCIHIINNKEKLNELKGSTKIKNK